MSQAAILEISERLVKFSNSLAGILDSAVSGSPSLLVLERPSTTSA